MTEARILPLVPPTAGTHLRALTQALDGLEADLGPLPRWAATLAEVLTGGGRLLAVGNGGSAAQAQHLTSELVGRYCSERQPFSALALHADTSTITALANDYGADEIFARQVRAHGRPGDILLALSTSGRSANVVAAVAAARNMGLRSWAVTGSAPNPLADAADEALVVDSSETATVQEVHLVVVHLLCQLFDERVCP
ncbi:MAG: D-sedoheptulose-7-phosphate isomerase [Acidimicrobiales bacterium]